VVRDVLDAERFDLALVLEAVVRECQAVLVIECRARAGTALDVDLQAWEPPESAHGRAATCWEQRECLRTHQEDVGAVSQLLEFRFHLDGGAIAGASPRRVCR
jgi:hypothetical protein